MKKGLISVIMSVYNEKLQWLNEAIESIINQTYKNIEFIIIVDNPSNLVLIETIKNYQKQDKRIKYFINESNQGLVYSLNRALRECTGQYIARMDADDISHLNRFENQLKHIEDNNLDLIGSNVNLFKDNNKIFFTTDKLLTHKYLKKMLAIGTIGIIHPTFFGKKEIFEKLNGYSNSLHTEDIEFLARVFCSNFKVGNIKDILLDCRYNNKSITKTNAIFVNKIGIYVVKVFKECLKTGTYNFDEDYHKGLNISTQEKEDSNKKQILMGEARKELNDKNYFKFLYNIVKATSYSRSVLISIRINLMLKLLKVMENIELKGVEK